LIFVWSLVFLPQIMILPLMSHVAGITDMQHHTQLNLLVLTQQGVPN
jgi:hypothetical protein